MTTLASVPMCADQLDLLDLVADTRAGGAGDSAESAPTGVDPVSPEVFPSAPIEGETKATVEDVAATDVYADHDWDKFKHACIEASFSAYSNGCEVDPAVVRMKLSKAGVLTINPRRLSAFYHRAVGKDGFLVFSRWGMNTDTKGRNAGRPQRIYKMREVSA